MWQNMMVDMTTPVCANFMNPKQKKYNKTLIVISA